MDLATIAGLIIGLGAVIAANAIKGGTLKDMYNLPAMLMILFGSFGAATISFTLKEVAHVPKAIAGTFKTHTIDLAGLVEQISKLAEKARREGLLALQDDAAALENPMLRQGVTMIVDGAEPEAVEETLTMQVEQMVKADKNAAKYLEKTGAYSPTIGIIGAVLGLIHTLSKLDDLSKIGPSIAVAFMATFYGILFANLAWLPLAGKIEHRIEAQRKAADLVITGVIALQTGESPRNIKEKLELMAGVGMEPGRKGAPAGAAGGVLREEEA